MRPSDTDDSLPALARAVLDSLQAPLLARFLAAWPHPAPPCAVSPHPAPPRAMPRGAPGRALPVLRYLPSIAAAGASVGGELVHALCRAAPSLAWRQSYSEREVGAAFLQNYGWSELFGPTERRAGAQISCGVLVLGPHTLYPHHRHEAEEVYLPLSGTAQWQQGDEIWRQQAPGTLIHHLSEEPHAMRTGEQALLAMYLWYGTDLTQKARLDAAARDGDGARAC